MLPPEVWLAAVHAQSHAYALVDACNAPAVLAKVQELGPERAYSLYRGRRQVEDLFDIAPYLVPLDETLHHWILAEMRDDAWGIFVLSSAPLETLLSHLARCLIVRTPGGSREYFRYYDPRVLRTLIPSLDALQRQQLFGPIQSFLTWQPSDLTWSTWNSSLNYRVSWRNA